MSPSLKRAHSDTESVDNWSGDKNEHSKKARRTVDEIEEQSDVEDIEVNLDDSSDEEQQLLPAQSGSKKEVVLSAGTVSRVEVVNFMCHKFLRIDLGPKVNFVIGHNGSGKSAILTAITVALGAKANSTNRAKKLSSLIREGANAAMVTVHITNKGHDAYRHDIYGDTIIIERKILKDGVGNYRIKSATNKTISNKREELTAILDHMVILVDNPLTILSQDMAREFLNSSSPHEKYKLFMRGTQLAQLSQDYAIVRESIDTMAAILKRKSQCLPDLQKRAKEAELKYKQLLALDSYEEKIETLSNELAWAQVIAKEDEAKNARIAVAKSQRQVIAAKEKLADAKDTINQLDQKVAAITEEMNAHRSSFAPNAEAKTAAEKEKFEAVTTRNKIKGDIQDANFRVQQAKAAIEGYDKEIQKNIQLQENSQSIQGTLQTRLVELNQAKVEKEENIKDCKNELVDLENQKLNKQEEEKNISNSLTKLQKTMYMQRKKIEELLAQKDNRLRAYGQSVPEVLEDIDAERRWIHKPVGPIGRFVKLKYLEYSETMEIVLGKHLNAFLVANYDDRRLLMTILERRRMSDTMVLVAKYDLFDYSSGEPDEKYLTVLRALEFEDEWVKRQLIVARGIEQILLIADREEANTVMENGGPRNVRSCYTATAQKVGAKKGMRTEVLNTYKGPQRFKKDIDSDISEAEDALKSSQQQSRELQQRKQTVIDELKNIQRNIAQVRNKQSSVDTEIRKITIKIGQTENRIQEQQPVDVQLIMNEKQELEDKIAMLAGQFQELKRQYDESGITLTEIMQRIHHFEKEEEECIKQVDVFRARIRDIESKKQPAMAIYSNAKEEYNKQENELSRKRNLVKHLDATVENWTAQVREEWPARVETKRSTDEIKRDIEHATGYIKEGAEAYGCTLDEAHIEAREALQAYDEAKRSIRLMEGLRKFMNETLDHRIDRWNDLRMYIALAARAHFTYYLHKRGDSGYLKINHNKEKLTVRVSTSDQFKKSSTRHKDSKTLSGGEKSFSQISLLLAMWQGISTPIICLDEFDVYMDAVNRKQSMRMLMDSALEQSDSQYIFITPQDASNMEPGPYVKVHRLNDPERQTGSQAQ